MAEDPPTLTYSHLPRTPESRRGPLDAVWFAVLFVSIAVGLGMTMFAPIGDEPPLPSVSTMPPAAVIPATSLTTAPPEPATQPSTSPTP